VARSADVILTHPATFASVLVAQKIEDALRNQYSIGYTPKRPGVAGQYRKIKLTTKQTGLTVQTRDGYYWK